MPTCHVTPFRLPGVLIAPSGSDQAQSLPAEYCDYCGLPHLEWRKCKLVCTNCRQINKSCADL